MKLFFLALAAKISTTEDTINIESGNNIEGLSRSSYPSLVLCIGAIRDVAARTAVKAMAQAVTFVLARFLLREETPRLVSTASDRLKKRSALAGQRK